MRLLIITQKVDKNDPILGFFHRWLEALAARFEALTVICLGEGSHALPTNVRVFSLGKEAGASRLEYVRRFYSYLWRERQDYDAVFVHMNQEYAILGGPFWRFMGKPVYLWRNHAHGTLLTRLAILLSTKAFYTSPSSYTARFGKSVPMPVGIDTDFFKPDPVAVREPHSLLFLGRISPVKKVLEFVAWFKTLGPEHTATVAGAARPEDEEYEKEVREAAPKNILFIGSVTEDRALKLYQTHETYANFTEAGSFDKTIFEAAACEMRLVVRNSDLKELEGKSGSELREFVLKHHSLDLLANRLQAEIR